MRIRHPRAVSLLAALSLLTAGASIPASAAPPSHAGPPDRAFDIEVVSGPADMVTGGDALVRIAVPRTVPVHQVRVTVDGRDVREAFRPVEDGRALVGLVDDLELGENQLEVAPNGRGQGHPDRAALTLVNHPAEGPVFSGEHIPLYCSADGDPWYLGEVDENCHVDGSAVSYQYRTTDGDWESLTDESDRPADLATTTTSQGTDVPYIVRVERGTINRAVYETAILHEPGTDLPTPWQDTPGWNERLVYTFGGACGIGHDQATSTGGVLNDDLLSRGYATASATFNVFANNCNDVTSAETAMMVKEHVSQTYGPPAFTMGSGGSAGTMQQLLIANAYPGILDGVLGHIGYPDERTTTVSGHECRFITQAIGASELDWTQDDGLAVTGFARFSLEGGFGTSTCAGYMFFDGVDNPTVGCPSRVPESDRYDAETNPEGIRCAIADFVSNVYGTDPDTGFGRPVAPDTVGVQYGLRAVEDGTITPEKFVDLNERIGGLDREGNRTADRSSADRDALELAYATGRVNQFDGGLASTPIIETRGYSDLRADFHDRLRSYTMKERLVAANGHADNYVSWTSPEGPLATRTQIEALETMDAWLSARGRLAIEEPDLDETSLTVRTRPEGLVDGCLDDDGTRIDEELTLDPDAACNELFPFHENPRIAAGGPIASDVLACQVVEMDRASYAVEFTDDQWDRLSAVFPTGVCDWSQPGIGQQPLTGTWLRF